MRNEKGYTFLEMVLALTISSLVVFNIFYIPVDLIKSNAHYSEFSGETSDVAIMRKTISRDLRNGSVDVNGERLMIGNKEYYFSDKVFRDSIALTEQSYDFEYNDGILEVYNENLKFKYNTKFSFKEDGDGDE